MDIDATKLILQLKEYLNKNPNALSKVSTRDLEEISDALTYELWDRTDDYYLSHEVDDYERE